MVHEVSHQNGDNEKWAHYRSDAAKESWGQENKYNGNTTGKSDVNQEQWVADQVLTNKYESTIYKGTEKAKEVKNFDPLMVLQVHEVSVGPIGTGSYHVSILFKPENQSLYKDDDRFRQMDPSAGKRYTTLGAGPKDANKLTGDFLRDKDKLMSNKILSSFPIISADQEDEVFKTLTQLNGVYNKNRVEYDTFPDPNKVKKMGSPDKTVGKLREK